MIPCARKRYRRLYNFGGDFIYAKSQSPSENPSKYNIVCDQMAINLVKKSLIIALLVSISLGMAICVPIHKLIFTDEREWILSIILPFIDPTTSNGFYINVSNQLIICALGGVVIPGSELIMCIIKNNVELTAKVIESSLVELEKDLKKSKKLTIQCDWKFREIILKILDFEKFVLAMF